MIMDRLYGGVCYAGIDTDPELKYPKGAGRVAFSNQQSYIAAISARFVQLQHGEIDKRVGFWVMWSRRTLFGIKCLNFSYGWRPFIPANNHIFLFRYMSRWKWSHMYWMTNCAMSVKAQDVEASSLLSSVPTWPVSSTTVNTAGQPFTRVPDGSFTSLWWRREEIGLATSPSGGIDPGGQGRVIRIHALFILLSPFYLEFFFKSKIVFILKFLIFFAEENAKRKWCNLDFCLKATLVRMKTWMH